ncbi:MAG: hypothetical protein WBB28_20760 [Crinalium sp.]
METGTFPVKRHFHKHRLYDTGLAAYTSTLSKLECDQSVEIVAVLTIVLARNFLRSITVKRKH